MATSGTTTFNMDLNEILEEAFERAGSELRTGYDFRTARRSLNLLFAEWANRGINLWTIDSGSQALTAGTATYDLPLNTVDLIEHVIRTNAGLSNQVDIPVSRISVSTYSSLPNKASQGRPIQIYVNRRSGATTLSGSQPPQFTLWPVPDVSSTYTLVYWRLRRIEDAGTGINTQEIPFRFVPALVAGLSYYLAMKIPEAAPRIGALKQVYDEAWQIAADEDRDRSDARFVPRQMFIR